MDWHEILNGTLATVFGGLILSVLYMLRAWLFRDNGLVMAKLSVVNSLVYFGSVISGVAPLTGVYVLDALQAGTLTVLCLMSAFYFQSAEVRALLSLIPATWAAWAAYATVKLSLSWYAVFAVFPLGFHVAAVAGMIAAVLIGVCGTGTITEATDGGNPAT